MKFGITALLIAVALLLPSCGKQSSYSHKKSIERPDTILDITVESNRIVNVYDYLNPSDYTKDTLVIFDLDNTLIHPPTDLGSDQWFYAMCKKLEERGMSPQEAINLFLPTFFNIMDHTWMIPTEPDTVSVINNLLTKGVTVLGLTARSIEMHPRTIEQLEHLGIFFSPIKDHAFTIKECKGKEGLYANGIIFSGNCDKGELLNRWLNIVEYHPKKVIFVDDKLKNIRSVETALHKRNYPFVGIRYGYLDDHIRTLDLDATEKEYEQFILNYPPREQVLSSMYA